MQIITGLSMNKTIYFLFFLVILFCGNIQRINAQVIEDSLRKELLASMDKSSDCWNNGDMEGFMHNYWKSDSLRFIGKKGITFGWKNTLANYKKSYPDAESRGNLEFKILSIEYLGETSILMAGRWIIQRTKEKLEGHFSLIWKKINNEWVIIFDHSS
jgi:hypothetical protein